MKQPVPSRRLALKLLPTRETGNRRIDNDESLDLPWNLVGIRVRNNSTHVVPYEEHGIDFESADQCAQVLSERLLVVRRDAVRISEPGQVRHNQPILLREIGHDFAPLKPCLRPAVQQYDDVS